MKVVEKANIINMMIGISALLFIYTLFLGESSQTYQKMIQLEYGNISK